MIEQLFKTHYARLVRSCYYMVNDQDTAEDLVQELFVKLLNDPSRLNSIENPAAYLTISVKNAAINHLNNQPQTTDTVPDQLSVTEDNKEEEIQQKLKLLQYLVSKLTPQARLVFSLSRYEGLSNQEIADYLEISKRTVETQISLALKSIREGYKSFN